MNVIVNEDRHEYSISGAVRDTQCQFLLAFGKQINKPISVVHGEILAILEGINLLYEKEFRDVQVGTDSLLTMQTITTKHEDLSYIVFCAVEVRDRMTKPVASELIHVHSSANKVVHDIARFAFSFPSSFVWVNGEFQYWLIIL